MKTIVIDGQTYDVVAQGSSEHVLIRAKESGVHFGRLKSREGDCVVLENARRVWYWSGAASLSQMAVEGVNSPDGCKFTVAVPEITILGVCEIIPLSDKARVNLYGVREWKV